MPGRFIEMSYAEFNSSLQGMLWEKVYKKR